MPPEVTLGLEELADGAVELPVVPVVPVVPVLPVLAVEEPLPTEPLSPEDEDEEPLPVVPALDVPDERAARGVAAPGWSRATTTPTNTVAPLAAMMAALVTARTRALAFSLFSGVLGCWPVAVTRNGHLLPSGRPYPTTLGSIPSQHPLWSC